MELHEKIRAIAVAHPGNLMARHFNPDYFDGLNETDKARVLQIIKSGLDNPDSQMGIYAMACDDYDRFAPLLDPMIRDYHNIEPDRDIRQHHNWGNHKGAQTSALDLAAIDPQLATVSTRIRIGRNLTGFPLPGDMSRAERVAMEARAIEAFKALRDRDASGGRYLSLTPGSPYQISHDEYLTRIKAHQMFKDMSADRYLAAAGIAGDWPHGRGMYLSEHEDFMIWVGEEDHLRIMVMHRSGNLLALLTRLYHLLSLLETVLPPFATSPVYGIVTSCPTNLGTAMRASVHLPLPHLTDNGTDLTRLKAEAQRLGMAVRGVAGEHSGAGAGGLVDLSPAARLGISESEIISRLFNGVKVLWALEQDRAI